MGLILDSSILIATERGRFDLAAFAASEEEAEPISICAITVSELLHGLERAPAGKRKTHRKQFIEDILTHTPVIPFDIEEARAHARLWAQLETKGQRIGAHDLIIASTCLHRKCKLATLNEKEFMRVPGLKLVESRKFLTGSNASS
jgi:predicted nucleic acid-binding protein